jgi:hypothetical protein
MANRDNKQKNNFLRSNKTIKNNINFLDNHLKELYANTYYNQDTNVKDSDDIRDGIEKSIDTIMMNNYSNVSIGNISKLYGKLQVNNMENNKSLVDAMNIFEDPLLMNSILATYNQNRWITEYDNEIDMILKYMPKLKEALNCKRDCVLSADHFAKDFINFHNTISQNKQEQFSKRMEEIKRVYELPQKFEQWYDETQKYGESYIYIVPYSAAFAKLLKNRNNRQFSATVEASIISENTISNEFNSSLELGNIDSIKELKVTLNRSGLLLSAADNVQKIDKIIKENKISSLTEAFLENFEIIKESKNEFSDALIPSDIELPKNLEDDRTAQDGIFTGNKNIRSNEDPKITVPGCIVKKLDRANVIPIYIQDVCLGYYYIEFKNGNQGSDYNIMEYSTGINSIGTSGKVNRALEKSNEDSKNKIINYVAKQLSDVIDKNFINANQDLRKELYMILSHNQLFNSSSTNMTGNIEISFLPAEDVVHIAFDKDPITHRGISDLAMSVFPAKLYACLYINHVLGTLTRGQDKRVYYVKQNVETNISKTLLNVLSQIKKGNFGARQMENLSSILNITGRFNDYIIPVSQSGDSPIQFEVMEGQKFEFQSELMDKLEEMAINSTDVPIDLINARQSLDYAIQATMSNSKLMRNVYKRQDIYESICSNISTKIYNYEYLEMETIEMTLPAPSFLNMTNGQQLIDGTIQYMDSLTNNQLANESDEVKNEFKKLGINYYLSTHINIQLIDKLIKQAKINVGLNHTKFDASQEEE